jgi:hypothetical protein
MGACFQTRVIYELMKQGVSAKSARSNLDAFLKKHPDARTLMAPSEAAEQVQFLSYTGRS